MAESSLKVFSRLPYTVRLLVMGTFVNNFGNMIAPFLALVLVQKLHFSMKEASYVGAAYGSGTFLSVVVGGWLTDRIGRRTTLLISLFTSGILAISLGLLGQAKWMLPFLFLFGFVSDLFRPASTSLIADSLPAKERPSGFASMRVANNLGWCCSAALGGFLLDWNWRALFWFDGMTTLGFATLAFKRIHDPATARGIRSAIAGVKRLRSPSPWRDWVFMRALFVIFLLSLVFATHNTLFPLTVTLVGHYSNKVVGALMALNGLVIGMFEIASVSRLTVFRRLRVSALGCVLIGIGLGLIGVWPHWIWFFLTLLLWTIGEILSFSLLTSFISDWAPMDRRGQYLGMNQASWRIATSLSPLIYMPLFGMVKPLTFWLIVPLPMIAAVWILLDLDRKSDHAELLRGTGDAPIPVAPEPKKRDD